MALVSRAKDGRADGGYTRLLGNKELGSLISKVHATVISSGTELEKIILNKIDNFMTSEDFDSFVENRLSSGTYVINKKLFKEKFQNALNTSYQPDFMVIVINDNNIYIIELKDGDTFDTKKATGEIVVLEDLKKLLEIYLKRNKIVPKNGQFNILIRFCSFNQDDKNKIVEGLKNKISIDMAMNGRDLCDLLNISYEEIKTQRERDQKDNFEYFLQSLLEIEEIKRFIKR